MKVYRIKHKPSGKYVNDASCVDVFFCSKTGKVFQKKCQNYEKFDNHPDYEILWDELKD